MPYPELFAWWAITISWGIAFLILVSMYLYVSNGERAKKRGRPMASAVRLVKDFVFVWVLLALLGLYIASIGNGSSILFAAGNIVIEVALFVYTLKNRTRESDR